MWPHEFWIYPGDPVQRFVLALWVVGHAATSVSLTLRGPVVASGGLVRLIQVSDFYLFAEGVSPTRINVIDQVELGG